MVAPQLDQPQATEPAQRVAEGACTEGAAVKHEVDALEGQIVDAAAQLQAFGQVGSLDDGDGLAPDIGAPEAQQARSIMPIRRA